MQMKARRLAVLAACALAPLAVSVSTASAAGIPTVTTQPASNVTATSAVLHGTVTANGSNTAWQFSYGQTAATLKLSPAQAGSIGATGVNVPVSTLVTGLKPNTTYSFTLLASNTTNGQYYPYYGLFTVGKTLTFTTAKAPGRGQVTLRNHRLRKRGRFITFLLRCHSTRTCSGRLTLTGKAKLSRHGRPRKFACIVRKSFSVRAGRTGHVRGRVTPKCNRALRFARHHTIHGRVNVTVKTGQRGLHTGVTVRR